MIAFDMSQPRRAALCVFRLTHNGEDFRLDGELVEHASLDAAWSRAWDLSAELSTSIACFGVRRIWL